MIHTGQDLPLYKRVNTMARGSVFVILLISVIASLCKAVKEDKAAFSAVLNKKVMLPQYSVVKFDEVMTNYQMAYNSTTGMFIAPSSGLYVFTWTIAIKWGLWQETQLMCNDDLVAKIVADSYKNGDRSTATGTMVLNVKENDKIYVRTGRFGDRMILKNMFCTFSGWKLYNS